MDPAWFGQVASVPSAKLECHAEAAAACAPPSPQYQQVGAQCPAPSSHLPQVRSASDAGLAGLLKALSM